MKLVLLMTASLAFWGLTACSVSTSAPKNPFTGGSDKPETAYSESNLGGLVFGQEWSAKTAVVRNFGIEGSNEVSLDLYAETLANACATSFSSLPSASVVIPASYQVTEYSMNLGAGNPMVFTSTQGEIKNILSDMGKLKITAISDIGFQAYVYAKATEADGTISEINGKVNVLDCRKAQTTH